MKTRQRILEFIIQYKKAYGGNTPVLSTISKAMGITVSGVSVHIDKLATEGEITIISEPYATLQVTIPGGHWIYEKDLTAEPVEDINQSDL